LSSGVDKLIGHHRAGHHSNYISADTVFFFIRLIVSRFVVKPVDENQQAT